jgi:phosphoglycolate phosphatase-like HAD superfamily hydrolase
VGTLFLFDIDGTLVTTDGAGRRAMAQAAHDLWGRRDVFDDVKFGGGLDSRFALDALLKAGMEPTPRRVARFKARYLRHLRRTMTPQSGRVLPGVERILAALGPHGRLSLLTGNWREGAAIKLGKHGIWDHFRATTSAFGGDAFTRGELLRVAWRRARRNGTPEHVVVVGDTPADVACARTPLPDPAVRVTAIAVATGFATKESLVRAEPDLLVDDLDRGARQIVDLLTELGAIRRMDRSASR